MALLSAMAALKAHDGGLGRILAAHCNHGLRGHESDEDQRLVEAACRELAIPCHVGRGDVPRVADEQGDGLEAAARHVRYDFLRQVAETAGARYVATAHTADDQAETILHRILRGTGVAGLAGMAAARPLSDAVTLVRPLLSFRRGEVAAYLSEVGQTFRHDSSNRDRRFTRNRIRHDLLPLLAAEYNGGVVDALLRLGRLARGAQTTIDQCVADVADRAVTVRSDTSLTIDVAQLAGHGHVLIRELLKHVWRQQRWPEQAMGFRQWDDLARLAHVPPASTSAAVQQSKTNQRSATMQRDFPGPIRATSTGQTLKLTRLCPTPK